MAISRILILIFLSLFLPNVWGETVPKGTLLQIIPDCNGSESVERGEVCFTANGYSGIIPSSDLKTNAVLKSDDDEGQVYELKETLDLKPLPIGYSESDTLTPIDVKCDKTAGTLDPQLAELAIISDLAIGDDSSGLGPGPIKIKHDQTCEKQLRQLKSTKGKTPAIDTNDIQEIIGKGVNKHALVAAISSMKEQASQGLIKNTHKFVVTDFSKNGSEARMHIISFDESGKPEVVSIKTSHGQGSDPEHDGMLNCFSSKDKSNATPRGGFVTGGTYDGKHGKSLRLHGLEEENATTCARHVVIHAATYVTNAPSGRSHGCPALDPAVCQDIISDIEGGTFVYHYGTQPNCK